MELDLNTRLQEIECKISSGNFTEALSFLNNLLNDCAIPRGLESSFPEFCLDNISVTRIPEISSESIRLISIIQSIFITDRIDFNQDNTRIIIHHKDWLTSLFRFSPHGNTDYILNAISNNNTFSGEKLWRLAALYTTESKLNFDWNHFFNENKTICMVLAFSLLSCSQFITTGSASMRDNLLTIIPDLIDNIKNLDNLPVELIHHAYMRCSYSTLNNKHAIKNSITKLIERDLKNRGFQESPFEISQTDQPIIVVILDWWTSTHAMYRCYSEAIKSLSKHFKIIALAHTELVDDKSTSIFDEVHFPFSTSNSAQMNFINGHNLLRKIKPNVLYFPSVGMSLTTLFFASYRHAPLQIASCGHPATTGSKCIDYMISSPEFYGDQAVYCEKIRMLPRATYSFQSIISYDEISITKPLEPIRIAITCSVYKLNPLFLETLNKIQKLSEKKIKYNFYIASAYGLHYVSAKKTLISSFPEASVYPNQNHREYITSLANNHMFLSPFPFGNTNGIVDAVSCNIPGVCLFGIEPHSAIDRGMFQICGLPENLIAHNVEDYIKETLNLINNTDYLNNISKELKSTISSGSLRTDSIHLFGENIYDLYKTSTATKL